MNIIEPKIGPNEQDYRCRTYNRRFHNLRIC